MVLPTHTVHVEYQTHLRFAEDDQRERVTVNRVICTREGVRWSVDYVCACEERLHIWNGVAWWITATGRRGGGKILS